jgi:hypothetical protein
MALGPLPLSPARPEPRRNAFPSLVALALFATATACYLRVVGFDWAFFDDDVNIVLNPHLEGWSAASLAWAWTDVHSAGRYLPLGWMTYDGAFAVFGLNPHGYHLLSVLFGAMDVVLLFFALRQWLRYTRPELPSARAPEIAAAAGALLWGLHPLRAETIGWNASLIYLTATTAAFVALILVLQASRTGAARPRTLHAAALVCYALSLLTYPIFIGLPVALWLGIRAGRIAAEPAVRTTYRWLLAWLALALAAGLFNLLLAHQPSASNSTPTWLEKLGLILRLNGQLASHVVWPSELSPYYGNAQALCREPRDWIALGVAAIAGLLWARTSPLKWIKLIGWTVATLALWLPVTLRYHPAMNAADRYTIGALAIVAASFAWFVRDMLSHPRWTIRFASVVGAAALSLLLLAGFQSTLQTWQNPSTVFGRIRHIVTDEQLEPSMIVRVLWLNGFRDEAFALIDQTLARESDEHLRELRQNLLETEHRWKNNPAYAGVKVPLAIQHCELGRGALESGKLRSARAHFREALRRWPDFPVAAAGLQRVATTSTQR